MPRATCFSKTFTMVMSSARTAICAANGIPAILLHTSDEATDSESPRAPRGSGGQGDSTVLKDPPLLRIPHPTIYTIGGSPFLTPWAGPEIPADSQG